MSTTFVEMTTMTTQNCCKCGVLFAMPIDLDNRLKKSHEVFYCPSGHNQHYIGQTEAQKLQKLLTYEREATEHARKQRDDAMLEAKHFRKSRDGMKGALRKVVVRVKNGVCPCCNRSFACLREHMAAKHPTYSVGATGGTP